MDLLQEIARYAKRAGIAESTFGLKAVNDGKFVARLRSGGGITVRQQERVRKWMADNPPNGKAA